MKLTFEGHDLNEIVGEMKRMLTTLSTLAARAPTVDAPKSMPDYVFEKPVDKPVVKPVHKPVETVVQNWDKPVGKPVEKKARSEKQLANDEKMRVAALERVEARRAAKKNFEAKAKAREAQQTAYATSLRKDLDRDPIEEAVQGGQS